MRCIIYFDFPWGDKRRFPIVIIIQALTQHGAASPVESIAGMVRASTQNHVVRSDSYLWDTA